MSIPKYMSTKKPSGISVVVAAEKLTQYVFRITSNEKQFPKAYRYTLSSALRNNCIDLVCHVYNGAYKRIVNNADYERVLQFQNAALKHLLNIKALMVVSLGIVSLNNPKHLAELYDETSDAFKRWTRNTRRAARKATKREDVRDEKYNERNMTMPNNDIPENKATEYVDLELAGNEDEVTPDDSLRMIIDQRFREENERCRKYGSCYDEEGFFVLIPRKTPFLLTRDMAYAQGMTDDEYNEHIERQLTDYVSSEDPTEQVVASRLLGSTVVREATLNVPINISF